MKRIFDINRHAKSPALLAQVMPDHPSAALIDAVEYVEAEVQALHAVQRERALRAAKGR